METQFIAGFLKESGFSTPLPDYSIQENPVDLPKPENGNRYLSGLILTYQPKWVPGLFLGYSTVNNLYGTDVLTLGDLVPIFNRQKGMYSVENRTRDKRQQFSSGFFRWLSSGGNFEFYGHGNNAVISAASMISSLPRNLAEPLLLAFRI